MIKLINDLWGKRRDIISDGFDESLQYISAIIPLKVHKIHSGTKCWTWTVPKKWSVREAWIKDEKGKKILDLNDHPLHVISYSLPVDKEVTKEELLEHIYTNPKRPNAIPWDFKYYERDWKFCMQHNNLKKIEGEKYRIFIDSKDEEGNLKVGDFTIKGKSDEIIILMAHLCHPAMANDDLAGVAVLVDIAKELQKWKGKLKYTYKILFVPETIGSIAFLSQNEDMIPKLKFGIFLEMLGNDNNHALQLSRQGDTKIDRIARYVLKKKFGKNFREGPFRSIVCNDEMVFNGPGVDMPMISISRYPYPEYHTSDDTPTILSEERLYSSKNLIMTIIGFLEKDYIPRRRFTGPVFLSGFGLWVDWKVNPKLNLNIEKIMLMLEGAKSVFDISEELDMDFYEILNYINRFYEYDLITKEEV